MKSGRLWWFEPRWSFVARVNEEWSVPFRPSSVLRVVGATALGVAVVAGLTRRYVPGVRFDWIGTTLLCLGGFYSFLLLMWALHLALPPIVEVRPSGIALSHGQSAALLRYDAIECVTIDRQASGRRILRITHRGRQHARGIADGVSLDELTGRLTAHVAVR